MLWLITEISSEMEYKHNGEKDTSSQASNQAPSDYRVDALPSYQKCYFISTLPI